MKWGFERNLHTNSEYIKFKAKEDNIEVIHLTYKELMSLYNYKFKSIRLSQVRDVYCFGCFTGLRFSDIQALNSSNIMGDYISMTILKTRTLSHVIPLIDPAKAILKKYKDTISYPLPVISLQKNNEYIKECCELVKIDTPTTITRYIGRKRRDTTLPKYQLITSHTARKTFITNSLLLGMNERVVRSITGHMKESSFNKYVKLTEEYKKDKINDAWNNKE